MRRQESNRCVNPAAECLLWVGGDDINEEFLSGDRLNRECRATDKSFKGILMHSEAFDSSWVETWQNTLLNSLIEQNQLERLWAFSFCVYWSFHVSIDDLWDSSGSFMWQIIFKGEGEAKDWIRLETCRQCWTQLDHKSRVHWSFSCKQAACYKLSAFTLRLNALLSFNWIFIEPKATQEAINEPSNWANFIHLIKSFEKCFAKSLLGN